jgi:hypothetical protein
MLQKTETPQPARHQRKLSERDCRWLADVMEQLAAERPDLGDDLNELREAVSLEQHEGTGSPSRQEPPST